MGAEILDCPDGACQRRIAGPDRADAPAQPARAGRERRTGLEPFVLAAAIGLGIWALLLSPLLF